MKDWKTTLIGIAGAILVCIAQAVSTGNVDIKTLITAAAIAAIGSFSGDAKVQSTVTGSPIIKELLPVADATITQFEKTTPSPILDKIHEVLTNIEANTAASAAPPAPAPVTAPVVQNIIQDQPVVNAAPAPQSEEAQQVIDPLVKQLNDAARENQQN